MLDDNRAYLKGSLGFSRQGPLWLTLQGPGSRKIERFHFGISLKYSSYALCIAARPGVLERHLARVRRYNESMEHQGSYHACGRNQPEPVKLSTSVLLSVGIDLPSNLPLHLS